jgi:hypothetical protein
MNDAIVVAEFALRRKFRKASMASVSGSNGFYGWFII